MRLLDDESNIDINKDNNLKYSKIVLKYNQKKLKFKNTCALVVFLIIFVLCYFVYKEPQFFINNIIINNQIYAVIKNISAIILFITIIINLKLMNKTQRIIVIERDSILFYNANKTKSININEIKKVEFNNYTNYIILRTNKENMKIDIRLENIEQFVKFMTKNLNLNVISNEIVKSILIKIKSINDKKYKILLKINKLRKKGKYKDILLYCKYMNSNLLSDVLYYFYSSKNIDDFNLCRYILENNYKSIKVLPMLEKVDIDKDRFLSMLDTIIIITQKDFVNINAFMYLILLSNIKYFKYIDDNKYLKIVKNLMKIKNMIPYLQKVNNNDSFINFLIEQHIKTIKYFNNQELLVIILQFLKYGNNEIKIYAIDTLIHNDMFVKDEYFELLAADPLYMNILYTILKEEKKLDLFPKHYIYQENFAISDFTEWMAFSTSIRQAPDNIEIVTDFEYNGLIYYIIKFNLNLIKINKKNFSNIMIGISGGYEKQDIPTAQNNGYTYTLFEAFNDTFYEEQAIKIIDKVDEIKHNIEQKNEN